MSQLRCFCYQKHRYFLTQCAVYQLTSMKANSVMARDPARLRNMFSKAPAKRPSCNMYTTSSEKVEKVVKPPQKPVVSNSFHTGSRWVIRLKMAMPSPMINAPTRLTVKVPRGKTGLIPFIFKLTYQRATLPTPPPIKTASNVLNIKAFRKSLSEYFERFRRHATNLSRDCVDIISLLGRFRRNVISIILPLNFTQQMASLSCPVKKSGNYKETKC